MRTVTSHWRAVEAESGDTGGVPAANARFDAGLPAAVCGTTTMMISRIGTIRRAFRTAIIVTAVLVAVYTPGGCGLGYLDSNTPQGSLVLRVENGTTDFANVSISITSPSAEASNDNGSSGGTSGVGKVRGAQTAKSSLVRLEPGAVSEGNLDCGEQIVISATVGEDAPSLVLLEGAGAGTEGFDSGSVGPGGERFLFFGRDFDCESTVIVRIAGPETGEVLVNAPGDPLPDPLVPIDTNDNADGGADPTLTNTVTFQFQNATTNDVDFSVLPKIAAAGSTEEVETVPTTIRVPAGQVTSGEMDCGPTFVVSGVMVGESGSVVTITGDGAGTIGFDEGSVGPSGERSFVYTEHYQCQDTIVVRLTDDGSGVGSSTGSTPLAEATVFASPDAVPDPDLPDANDNSADTEPVETVFFTVSNNTDSYAQVTITSGADETAQSVDVRVPPMRTTTGNVVCAQQFSLSAFHLESPDSTAEEGFHTVVLTGDGTGVEGFDENNVGTDNSRLLLLDSHFACGDVILVTIDATNNGTDEETGETSYGIGDGEVTVK